jgi:hypothetical protein
VAPQTGEPHNPAQKIPTQAKILLCRCAQVESPKNRRGTGANVGTLTGRGKIWGRFPGFTRPGAPAAGFIAHRISRENKFFPPVRVRYIELN